MALGFVSNNSDRRQTALQLIFHRFQALTMISVILFFGLSFVIKQSKSQGFDAGAADPLGFGLIDPVSLEIAATYVFIIPMVIFLVGILAIPASLVIVFLVAQPIIVPPEATEGRRKRSVNQNSTARMQNMVDYATDLLSKSQCLNRLVCEIGQGVNSSGEPLLFKRNSLGSSHKRRGRNKRSDENRYNCSNEFPCTSFDFFMAIGNAAWKAPRK